jgi:hypothetical protein
MMQQAIELPRGWSVTDQGMGRDGDQVIDGVRAWLRDGQIEVQLPAPDGRTIPCRYDAPPPEALAALPDDQREELRLLLEDLDDMRPSAAEAVDAAFTEASNVLFPLQTAMALYTHAFDLDVIVAGLATGVAQAVPGDPLWLMLVHASSGGKSEVVRLLDGVTDERLKEVTKAGLLSRTQGQNSRPTGLLTRYQGGDALFTISDLSPMLGDSRQSSAQKSELWNAFRDIYDGEWAYDLNVGPVRWQGRITMLAACTPAIDTFSAYADALGTRWLQYRPPQTPPSERLLRSDFALRRGNMNRLRADARDVATEIILGARTRIPDSLPEHFMEPLAAAADLAAYGRAAVPRAFNREVDGIVEPEEPMRLAGQLRSLALACLALGVGDQMTMRVVHRAALSSMPQARRRVLEALVASDEPLSVSAVARAADLHRHVARRALEDWTLIGTGFVEPDQANEDGEASPGAGWRLSAENRDAVRNVIWHAADIQMLESGGNGVSNVRRVPDVRPVPPTEAP